MLQSFNLFGLADKTILARRICMYITLGTRTVNSVFIILHSGDPASFIVQIIISVIAFLCVAYFLHLIDRRCIEGGEVRCFTRLGAPHFNAFMIVIAIIHTGFLVGFFVGLPIIASRSIWILLWLCIIGAGWVASWQPEPPSRSADVGV